MEQYSDEELERRKKGSIPQSLEESIDWNNVKNLAIQRRDQVVNGSHHLDNDDKYYIFEAVMEAVFGLKYFEWENENTQ